MRNAVALLAPSSALYAAVHVASSALAHSVLFLVNLRTHGFVQVERRHCSLINQPEMPPPNLNSTNVSGYMVLCFSCNLSVSLHYYDELNMFFLVN